MQAKNVAVNLGGARERTESNVRNRRDCNVLDTLVEQQEHERKIFYFTFLLGSQLRLRLCVRPHGFRCSKVEGILLTLYARLLFLLFHKHKQASTKIL